ncbi:MAG: hypothetical protein ABIT38_19785 [Gemmatimonadaceae bacterium]
MADNRQFRSDAAVMSMRFRVLPRTCIALLLATPVAGQTALARPDSTPRNLPQTFAILRNALPRGDQQTVRRALEIARRFAPDDGTVLVFLARAQAATGDPTAALQTLERLAVQGAVLKLESDSSFKSLRVAPYEKRFAAVTRRLERATAPIVRSDTAFALADPDFIPEGIAHDPSSGAAYIGSLTGRGVLRLTSDGRATPFLTPGSDVPAQILGIRIDATAHRLWLAALTPDSTAPRFENGPGGWAALHAYDLTSGALLARYPAPDSTRPHLLNDIAITPNGDAYVTDSEGRGVYRLRAGAARLEPIAADPLLFNYPNGVTVTPNGARLYVAHMEGVSTLDLRARNARLERVLSPRGVSTGGIDGLYMCDGALYAVQALYGFQQVTRFPLSGNGRRVLRAEALERRHPAHEIATTGAFARGGLLYIANAQIGRLTPTGSALPTDHPAPSVILRLPVGHHCERSPTSSQTR